MALSKPVDQIVEEKTNPLLVKHESWERVPIGEIAEIDNGFAFKSKSFNKQGEGMPLIRIRDVTKGETETYYDGEYDEPYLVNPGDLLIGMDGDFNSARWTGRQALLNQRVCRVRLVSEVYDEGFLTYALQPYLDEINKETSSVTVKHLSSKTVSQIPLPFPPLPEQRRIVARIEELFSRLDAGVAALRHAKAQLQRYRQSVLAAAVTCQLNGFRDLPTSEWKPIATAIKSLGQGWSPKCKRTPSESNDVWGVIKTTAIQAGDFVENENKELPAASEPRPNIELQADDLLITRAGPRKRVGVACHVKRTRPRLMLCDKAYRIRTLQDVATPSFLALALNAPQVTDELERLKTGINDSGLNLTQKRFKELKVPLPAIEEQHQIVAEVEARTTAIEHLEAELDRQITRSNRLRQSTLASAFRGDL